MDIIKWRDSYNLGIPKIDEQHKKLVEILNQLYKAMRENQAKDKMNKIISELKQYTVFHFSFEESLLQSHNYPELQGHKNIHKEFVGKIDEFRSRQLGGDSIMSIDLSRFLKDWLIDHIQGTDKEYAVYLETKGLL